MFTEAMIRRAAPNARPDYIKALTTRTDLLEKYGFNTEIRCAHFLAQVLHETGRLTIVRENMNYSEKNLMKTFSKRYAGHPELARAHAHNPKLVANFNYGFRMGNERDGLEDDDGFAFRGGGMAQTTGYDNYKAIGLAIGQPLDTSPELIENAEISMEAACWEFAKFVEVCDLGEAGLLSFSNGINRGDPDAKAPPNGWADRQQCFQVALDVMTLVPVNDRTLAMGSRSEQVALVQQQLTKLLYASGDADGIFGSRTRVAVLSFQAENGLTTDGRVGPQTRAALFASDAKPFPIRLERAEATVTSVIAAGSTTMAAASNVKLTGQVTAVVSGVAGAASLANTISTSTVGIDVLAAGRNAISEISQLKTLLEGGETLAHWALGHWWIFGCVIGFGVYRWGRNIEWSKLLAHRLGFDLSH